MRAALGGTEPGGLAPLEVVKGHLGASATIVMQGLKFFVTEVLDRRKSVLSALHGEHCREHQLRIQRLE